MTTELSDFLLYVPIFSDLPRDIINQIGKIGTKRKYKKDNVILLEEESGNALFVVISGKVKIARESSDGKEVILTILSESDFFGEMSILSGLTNSATVISLEDSELFMIQKQDFLELLKQHPQISISLLEELSKRLQTADMKIKALSLKNTEGKVAIVLLQVADNIGKIKQGVVEIENLPIHQDLANMTGTSRETISRTLHTFAKKGLVEMEGSKLRILNYERFKELYI